MGAYLAQHLDLPLGRERIRFGQHNGKSNLPTGFRIPGQVGLFTWAFSDQMFDAVAADENRAIGKRNVHSAAIVALPLRQPHPNQSAPAGC
jgi:hypothetical protein